MMIVKIFFKSVILNNNINKIIYKKVVERLISNIFYQTHPFFVKFISDLQRPEYSFTFKIKGKINNISQLIFYINENIFIGTNITLSTFSIVFVVSDITIPCGDLYLLIASLI